jgi:hypothetical protein
VPSASQTDPISALPIQSLISLSDASATGNHSDTTYDLSEAAFAFDFALVGVPDFMHNASGNDNSSATLTFISHAQVTYNLAHEFMPSGIVPMVDNVQLQIDLTDTTGQPLSSYHFLANDLEPPFESGSAIGVLLAEHVYQLTYQTHAKAALGGSNHVTDAGSVTLQIAHVPEPDAQACASIAALALLAARRSGRMREGARRCNR